MTTSAGPLTPISPAPGALPSAPGRVRSPILLVGGVIAVLLAASWLMVLARFGSLRRASQYVQGLPLAVDATTQSFGTAVPDSKIKVAFRLTNLGSAPVRILGSQVDCSCLVHDDRPFALAGGADRLFELEMATPHLAGAVTRNIVLFTDVPRQREVRLAITGDVAPTSTGGH